MYRKRTKHSAKLIEAMRRGRDAARMARAAPEYPVELPKLRRVVIVIDYDTGAPVIETLRLYRTARIDSYKAVANGKVWREKIGWSGVLEGIRKSFIRLESPRHIT